MSESKPDAEGELDFLKTLAPPSEAPARKNRFQLTLQILAVPASILAVSVGIFVIFSFLTNDAMAPRQLLDRVNTSSGPLKAQYANQLAVRIREQRGDLRNPAPPEVRQLAGPILQSIRDIRTKSEYSDQDVDTLYYLIHSLSPVGDPASAVALAEIMEQEKSDTVLAACLDALGAIKNPDTMPAVYAQLDQGSPFVRKYAAFNLAAFGRPETADRLRSLLEDESMEIRWNAAFGLAYFLKDSAGTGVLRGMLESPRIDPKDPKHSELRKHAILMAAEGLAVIKDAESLSRLEELAANDPDAEVRVGCRAAAEFVRK